MFKKADTLCKKILYSFMDFLSKYLVGVKKFWIEALLASIFKVSDSPIFILNAKEIYEVKRSPDGRTYGVRHGVGICPIETWTVKEISHVGYRESGDNSLVVRNV